MRSAVNNVILISSLFLTANIAFAEHGRHRSHGRRAVSAGSSDSFGPMAGSGSNATTPSLPVPSAWLPLGYCLSVLALKRARRLS